MPALFAAQCRTEGIEVHSRSEESLIDTTLSLEESSGLDGRLESEGVIGLETKRSSPVNCGNTVKAVNLDLLGEIFSAISLNANWKNDSTLVSKVVTENDPSSA